MDNTDDTSKKSNKSYRFGKENEEEFKKLTDKLGIKQHELRYR